MSVHRIASKVLFRMGAVLAATFALIGLVYFSGLVAPSPASAATITVTDASDGPLNGANEECSLREAITNANTDTATQPDCDAGTGEDTIVFDAGVTNITLAADLQDITDEDGLTIDGAGAVTINGDGSYRPFSVGNTGVLTLEGLVIRNGLGDIGGGIANEGTLLVLDSTVTENSAMNSGGGIVNSLSGELTVQNSTVSHNVVTSDTGGGGGIINFTGEVTLINSVIGPDNVAGNGAGLYNVALVSGGVAGGPALIAAIDHTEVSENDARYAGGGILNHSTLLVTDSTISRNAAVERAGGIDNLQGATAMVTGSTINGNTTAGDGGGISNEGANIDIVSSTLSGNTAAFGGALRSNTGGLALANSTVSGNTAVFGGGIYNGDQNTTGLTNVTITDNTATTSGGGVYSPADAPGDVVMRNALIADQQTGGDCAGTTFISMGHNLDSDNTCNLNQGTDLPGGNADLGPLANNGGATQTHALLPGSDAIDAGNDAVCAADPIFNVDQRGAPRPQGPQCDIGAFEASAPTPTPSATPEATDTPTPTASVTTTPTLSPTSTPTASGPMPVERELVWADVNCSDVADPVDALITLRFDAGLSVNIGDCPPMGTAIEVLGIDVAGLGEGDGDPQTWGDADCGESISPIDALKILRYDAALSVSQQLGCPPIGSEVTIQHEP